MLLLNTLLAALPLLLILALMMWFRWGGAKSGAVGWGAALIIAGLHFGATPSGLLWSQIQALFLAIYVLYIIWGALLFFRITEAAGMVDALGKLLKQYSPERSFQAILLAWGFASFLQGVGGFGVPIAVVAPLLVSMGFPPSQAVIMPSIGHAWAISFGSLGSSFFALIAATGLEGQTLATWMAVLLGCVCLLSGPLVLWIAGGKKAIRRNALPVGLMALAMGGIQIVAARTGLWNISAMLGSLAGLFIGIGWTIFTQEASEQAGDNPKQPPWDAVLPYGLLLAIIFATRFIQPLSDVLNLIRVSVPIPAITTQQGWHIPAGTSREIAIFGHPGALLIYASLLTLWVAKRRKKLPPGSGKKIRQGVLRSGLKSTLGILTMVAMATTMDNAGMVNTLSQTMAQVAGKFFPLVSPFIGALGAFMTGSNTNANVLFGAFQRDVALKLGYFVPLILAGHNAGAAVGSIFAPAKVIVGCSTVGLSGKEGETLLQITRYSLAIICVLALLTWALA